MKSRTLSIVALLIFSLFIFLPLSSAAPYSSGWFHSNTQFETGSRLINQTITGVFSSTPIYLDAQSNKISVYNNSSSSAVTVAPFGPQFIYSNISTGYFNNYTYYNESLLVGVPASATVAIPSLNNSIYFNGNLIFWSQEYANESNTAYSTYNFNGTILTSTSSSTSNQFPMMKIWMNFTDFPNSGNGKMSLFAEGGLQPGASGTIVTYSHSYNLASNKTLSIRSYSYSMYGTEASPVTYWFLTNSISGLLSTAHDVNFIVGGTTAWNIGMYGPAGNFETTTGKITGLTNGIYHWWIYPGYAFGVNHGIINVNNTSLSISINPITPTAPIPQYYVPVTLLNSYDYYSPLNYSERISMDWQAFSSYLDPNLSNVRIYDSIAFTPQNELSGWIATNDTSSSASSMVFVNLSDYLVPAQGHATIYFVFMQKSVTWGPHWGLSPILSTFYGQYDNGHGIFSSYFNALEPLSDFSGSAQLGRTTYDGHVIFLFNNSVGLELNKAGGMIGQDFSSGSFWLSTGTSTTNTGPILGVSSGNIVGLLSGYTDANFTIENKSSGNYNGYTFPAYSSVQFYYAQYSYYDATATFGMTGNTPYSGPIQSLAVSSGLQYPSSGVKYLGGYGTTSATTGDAMPISYEFLSRNTPNNAMPVPTFGAVAIPIYPVSFTSYGLPPGTSWTVAIGFGSGTAVEQISSTGQNISSYLPNGTYTYTVGSLSNQSYQSGFDHNLTPSPSGGQLIVTGSHTNQVIIWNKAELLLYNLIPGTATLSSGRIILPVFVVNANNVPANNSTIREIWQHLKMTYVSINNTASISFQFASSGYGEFSIFINLSMYRIVNITRSNATVSMVSPFNKTSGYTDLAVGTLGPTAFALSNLHISVNPSGTSTTAIPFYQTAKFRDGMLAILIGAIVFVVLYVYWDDDWFRRD